MSYNILNKNVNFQGATKGTVEDLVDTHTAQPISGSKDFNDLTGSNTHIVNTISVATHAVDHAVSVAGAVSASLNISASAFYAAGVLIEGGSVSAVANGADNRIATFSSTDALNGEANLTFDGSVLDFKATSISGSGNISGSQFYGGWSGDTIAGSKIQLGSNGGLVDSSGLKLNAGVSAVGSLNTADKILLFDADDSDNVKRTTAGDIANLFSAAVTSYSGDTDNRVITSGGSKAIVGEPNLTFDGSTLVVTGDVSGSGHVSASLGWFGTKVTAGSIELGDAAGIAGAGLVNNGGVLDIQTSGAVLVVSDKVGITGSFADLGLAYNGGVNSISSIKLDLNSLADTAINRANDYIPFIDADDNQPKKESVTDFVGFIAGSGLDNSSGQLSVDVSDFLTNGLDNRLVTATGADALNAEANLLFDGSTIMLTGSMEMSGSGLIIVAGEGLPAEITLKADQGDDAAADIGSIRVENGASMIIDTGGNMTFDADGGSIFIKDNNTDFSEMTRTGIETDAMYAGGLVFSASAGPMKLDSFTGEFLFASASATKFSIGNSGNNAILQPSGDAANDIIFTDGDESANEIGRFDGSATALLMAGTNKVMFNDNGTYINSSTNSQLDIVADGSVVFANTSTTVFTPASVHNFTGDDANATIPITATYVKIDANGSARTGMRFGGAGTAGQFLIVENAGGENVTFHGTGGTALITTNSDNDTMMPGEVFSFVSNGSSWFLIGGDLQPG